MNRWIDVPLTCTSFSGSLGLVFSTPGAQSEHVESTRYQITKHTLVPALLHFLVLKDCVVVHDCYVVMVIISSCVVPVHLQDIFLG